MTSERRFSEQEVAYILERAATADTAEAESSESALAGDSGSESSPGMTLAQLTEVAREAGIEPSALIAAARAVEQGALVPTQQHTAMGIPVSVSRTAEFSRPVTNDEWERLVVALRETFQARGTMRQEGSLRSWSNGNLHAMLEPTAAGHRLRMRTTKSNALPMLWLGVGGVVMAGVVGVALAFKPDMSGPSFVAPGLLAALGAVPILRTVLGVPRWARTRATQLEMIASTAAQILNESDARAALAPGAAATPASATSLPRSYTDE